MTYGCATCREAEEKSSGRRTPTGRASRTGARAPVLQRLPRRPPDRPDDFAELGDVAVNEPRRAGAATPGLEQGRGHLEAQPDRALQAVGPLAGLKEGGARRHCRPAAARTRSSTPTRPSRRPPAAGSSRSARGATQRGKAYKSGGHGRTLIHGNHDVPTCITCHGDHDMTSLRGPAGDAPAGASTQVCIWCHGNERMMKRYALDTSPVNSYLKDFHGLTQRGTLGSAATCADCHDAHHSLRRRTPSRARHLQPRHRLRAAVPRTGDPEFHHELQPPRPRGRRRSTGSEIRKIYIALIVITIGGDARAQRRHLVVGGPKNSAPRRDAKSSAA